MLEPQVARHRSLVLVLPCMLMARVVAVAVQSPLAQHLLLKGGMSPRERLPHLLAARAVQVF
jgi:hypothetical protein